MYRWFLFAKGFAPTFSFCDKKPCNVDTKVALPWLPEFFFLFGGNGLIDSALVRFSPLLCERPLASREAQCELQKRKLRSLKLKTPYLGPDLPSMFLKLIIFPLLLLQEQSSNFVHTSRLDTLTARKDSSKKTIDPSAMFCRQNRERTGEKFPGCEVMYEPH